MRSRATRADSLTRKTLPRRSPPRSAIQQRSRAASKFSTKSATRVERGVLSPAAAGEAQVDLAPVGARSPARHQAAAFEAPQDAAQVAGVEAELGPDEAGRGAPALGDLVQHAHLDERQCAAQ